MNPLNFLRTEIRGHYLAAKVYTVFKSITDSRQSLRYIIDNQDDSRETARVLLRAAQLAVDTKADRIYLSFPLRGLGEKGTPYENQEFEGYLLYKVKPSGEDIPDIIGPMEVGARSLMEGGEPGPDRNLVVPVSMPVITSLVPYQLFTGYMNLTYKDEG
jgi:hypothetical protein